MIPLRLKAEFDTITEPFVVKLEVLPSGRTRTLSAHQAFASPRAGQPGTWECDSIKEASCSTPGPARRLTATC